MNAMMPNRWRRALALAVAVGTLTGCGVTAVPMHGRLTPVRARITDEAIERDLALIAQYDRRIDAASPGGAGAQRYVATRAKEYLALARDAYERNDRSSFADDALGWALADLETLEKGGAATALAGPVPAPAGAREIGGDQWARAEQMRRDTTRLGAPEDVARAELALVRAAHAFLAGPACVVEGGVPLATRFLDDADSKKLPAPPERPLPEAPRPEAPRPEAPRPEDRPVPPRPGDPTGARRDCASPEDIAGVPNIVHFALDRSQLAATTREVLDQLVTKLAPYPAIRIVLAGHTDPRHTDAYNQALSERRVRAVRDYLLLKGVEASRLETRAYGESRLLVPGTTARDHARNRRVEISYALCDGTEVRPVEALSDLQLEAARRRAVLEKD